MKFICKFFFFFNYLYFTPSNYFFTFLLFTSMFYVTIFNVAESLQVHQLYKFIKNTIIISIQTVASSSSSINQPTSMF